MALVSDYFRHQLGSYGDVWYPQSECRSQSEVFLNSAYFYQREGFW